MENYWNIWSRLVLMFLRMDIFYISYVREEKAIDDP